MLRIWPTERIGTQNPNCESRFDDGTQKEEEEEEKIIIIIIIINLVFAVPSNRPSFHTRRHLIVVLLCSVYLCLLASDVWPLGGSFSGRKLVSRNLTFSWRLM